MSFPAMAWAVRQKLPCTQKIVLLMLAERHNKDTGQCNPSHDRLADDCGLTRRSVMDQISKLEVAGYIRIRHRAANNVKLPNQYVLVFSLGIQEEVKDFEEVPLGTHKATIQAKTVVNVIHQGSEPRSLGVVNHVPGVVNVIHQGSEPRSHKPGIEPVKNLNTNTRAEALVIVKPALSIAKPEEVSQEVWADFLTHRKEKRAKLTNTALSSIKSEADKAGWALEKALTESCARGWTSFKAEWVANKPAAMTASRRTPSPETFAERDAANKRRDWEAMTGRVWPTDNLPSASAAPFVIDVPANEPRRIS